MNRSQVLLTLLMVFFLSSFLPSTVSAKRRLYGSIFGGLSLPIGLIDGGWNPGWHAGASLEWNIATSRLRQGASILFEAERHLLAYDNNGRPSSGMGYSIEKYGAGLKIPLSSSRRGMGFYLAGTAGVAYPKNEDGTKIYLQPAVGLQLSRKSFFSLKFTLIPTDGGGIHVLGLGAGIRF